MFDNEADKVNIPNSRATLSVENIFSANPEFPLPFQYLGNSYANIRGKKYIPFLGFDNTLPNTLLEVRLGSPTQNNCIKSITASVIGNGLQIKNQETVDQRFTDWAACVNNQVDTFDDVLYSIEDSFNEQGNAWVEVVKGSLGPQKFIKIYVHPGQYCRFAELEKSERYPTKVVITKQFARRGFRFKIDDAQVIPLYSPNKVDQKTCWVDLGDGLLRTMLHHKNRTNGIDFYGMPESIPGLLWQVLEYRAAQYNKDNFDNNMILGGMLTLKSAMTEPEAQKTARKIIMSHIGEGKTGRIAVVSSETGLDDVTFTPYTTKAEGSYLEFNKAVEEKIISCNNWDGVLCGINRNGSLGNGSGYIRSVWDAKEASLLNPHRRKLVDKIVSPILKIFADVYNITEVAKYDPWFNSALPFSLLGDLKPEQFVKVKEARDWTGLEFDKSVGEKYLSEMVFRTTNTVKDDPKITPQE